MRRRVSGKTAGEEVSWVQLYGWSGGQARYCAEGLGSVQGENPGDHGTGKGSQHEDDDGGTGTVYAGLAQLFRILRNARGAGFLDRLGAAPTAMFPMAAVENKLRAAIVGSDATVMAGLEKLVGDTGADEVIVVTDTFEHADRLQSYQRVARVAATIELRAETVNT